MQQKFTLMILNNVKLSVLKEPKPYINPNLTPTYYA